MNNEENLMKNRRFRSPLIFSAEKFSRFCTRSNEIKDKNIRLGFISKSLYVFILFAINMILFASSGSMVVFNNSILPAAEILILLLILLIISFGVIGVFYKKTIAQNIVCCLVTFWFVVTLFNQFYQLDPNAAFAHLFLGDTASISGSGLLYNGSHIVIAFFVTGLFALFIFNFSEQLFAVCVGILTLIFFIILQKDSLHTIHEHDFIEISNTQLDEEFVGKNRRFIYIMLPNLSSYKYFSTINNPLAKDTTSLITGFYANNNFEIYPNAFIEQADPFMNIVQSVNTFSNQYPDDHTLNHMILYKYWKFFNINDEYVFLKNNQLYDSFRKAGYRITAYKSRGVDMCHENHELNVDRCMEKINSPVNIYDSDISTMDRLQLFFAEWIHSMNILSMKPLYYILDIFSNPEELPLIGINYNNLYVINSIKTFDILAENILSDTGKQAYFVYADIPSNMFIYDEFCNIKPQEEWISVEKLPWVNNDYTDKKQRAYIDQTKCLYGKLQEFIDSLNKKHILDSSVLIINGISSNHNFESKAFDSIVDNFVYDKMVSLAIKSPLIKTFKVNNNICSTKNIIQNAIFNVNSNVCETIDNLGIRGSLKDELLYRLSSLNEPMVNIVNNTEKFSTWYEKWLVMNNKNKKDIDIFKKEEDLFSKDINDEAPEIGNEILQ